MGMVSHTHDTHDTRDTRQFRSIARLRRLKRRTYTRDSVSRANNKILLRVVWFLTQTQDTRDTHDSFVALRRLKP